MRRNVLWKLFIFAAALLLAPGRSAFAQRSLTYPLPPSLRLDLNNDGKGDILFQNQNSGQVYGWLMNGLNVLSTGSIWDGGDPAWQVVGFPDLNGDGDSDIVFQNTNTGAVYAYLMNGVTVVSSNYIWTGGDPTWKVVGF